MKTRIINVAKATLLAVLCFDLSVTIATAGDPIPGVDIILQQVPGGIMVKTKTGKDGSYNFSALKPGAYLLKIPGQPDRKISVGAEARVQGKVTAAAKSAENK